MAERYQSYLESDEWKATRRAAIHRAGARCQLCGKRGGALEVHHNSYDNVGHEKPEDLTVLCRKCHRRHHGGKVTAGTIRDGLTRRARQLVRLANLEPQDVPLTTSERRRRQKVALRFIARGR